GGAKSTAPVQTKNEPKTLSTIGSRTEPSATPKPASPPAKGLAENAAKAGALPNGEAPKKAPVSIPKITSQKEANSQPHSTVAPQTPSLSSVGKPVTPLPPRVE